MGFIKSRFVLCAQPHEHRGACYKKLRGIRPVCEIYMQNVVESLPCCDKSHRVGLREEAGK